MGQSVKSSNPCQSVIQTSSRYKQTEVGVIPKDWDAKTIGEAFHVIAGGDFDASRSSSVQDDVCRYPIYSNALSGSGLHGFCSYADHGEGSITVTARGTLGAAVYRDHPFTAIGRVLVLKPKCPSNGRFFAEYINSSISFAVESTGVPQLTAPQVSKYWVPLPPLPEQHAIAAALRDVDALITSLDTLIAKKRDIKQAAMQQLLTGKTRLPGFSGDWDVKKLGEIAEIRMGSTPSRANQDYWGRGNKWMSIADLTSKHVFETREEITDLAAARMMVIPKGTLVMSFKLSIGKLAFVGCDMYSNEAICHFSALRGDGDYLYYALGRTDFSRYGKQAVKGYTLNMESLAVVEIPFPSLEEQKAIATVLSDMDAEIAALERRRDKTRALKQGMMQELLTGRTRLV
jgi:type I restriction enzyme, S subunit